jgi:thioredoxin reductase (NADPH)
MSEPHTPPPTPPGTAVIDSPNLGTEAEPYDCAIIGGGPAGLSAAVQVSRLRRSCMVLDDHEGRSLWYQVNRNYLGFPQGIPAADLRKLGRRQAAEYGAHFCNASVASITRHGGPHGPFRVVTVPPDGHIESGSPEQRERDEMDARAEGETQITGRDVLWTSTLIFATGVVDHFPEFVGRDECVGRTLFWCILCDGYESLGKRVVILGADEEAASTALQFRQFTNTITLVAGQPEFNLPASRLEDLEAGGITALAGRVQDYPNADGCVTALVLEDGTRVPLDMIFAIQEKHPRTELARTLGVQCDGQGYIAADDEQKTNVPGVYAAGDVTRKFNHQISSAVHEGGMAAAAANYYLYGRLQKEKHAHPHVPADEPVSDPNVQPG